MSWGPNIAWYRAGLFVGLASVTWIVFTAQVEGQSSTAPQYDSNGNLRAPVGFEAWVFVGSNLGLAYKPGLPVMTALEASRNNQPQFHNVFINPEAYAHFLATREFPAPTILVIEKFSSADKEPKGVVSNGVFNGDWMGLEVAVKNPARPDGGTTPWAYYDFTNPTDPSKPVATAPAQPDQMCENCHREHASLDHVWVQFYPILRNLIK
jgi:cytochrome P460